MKKSYKDIQEEQAERLAKYPADRIPFRREQNTAAEDQKNIRRYIHHEITLAALCRLIAKSNQLESVSKEAMLNELRQTGWLR